MSDETIITRQADLLFNSSNSNNKSCLVKIYPPGIGDCLVNLPPLQRFTIGRDKDCSLNFPDDSVSRHHAFIECKGNRFWVTDMGSTNGTYVNDEPIEKRRLETGDYIRIGQNILKFLSSDHVETQYHETIFQMMTTDMLTSARNKQFFLEALDRELVRSQRHHRPLSLIIFDIDHFKSINDTHGHLAGDAVLRELGNRIRSTIRKDEVFARYGGEEFAVILPESARPEAMGFSERLRKLVASKPMLTDSLTIPVTISVGFAVTHGESDLTPLGFIKQADDQLYTAKQEGRNRVHG